MISLITDDGILLDFDDSKGFIAFYMKREFLNYEGFIRCKEALDPDFWGSSILMESKESFIKWIQVFAKQTLI